MKERLDALVATFDVSTIEPDPLQLVLRYDEPLDQEVAGLIAAAFAYGRAETIVANIGVVLTRMTPSPFRYLATFDPRDAKKRFAGFAHRFHKTPDLVAFLGCLAIAIREHGSLGALFEKCYDDADDDIGPSLARFVKSVLSSADAPLIRPPGTFSPQAGRRGTGTQEASSSPLAPQAGRRGTGTREASSSPLAPQAGRRGTGTQEASSSPLAPRAGRTGTGTREASSSPLAPQGGERVPLSEAKGRERGRTSDAADAGLVKSVLPSTVNRQPSTPLTYLLTSPDDGSACKRMNLYLRWMVRRTAPDLGLWTFVDPAKLLMPLDTHVHRIATFLGLSERKSADWKAARALTDRLARFDPADPVRYDFALCRLGILDLCSIHRRKENCDVCLLRDVCRFPLL